MGRLRLSVCPSVWPVQKESAGKRFSIVGIQFGFLLLPVARQLPVRQTSLPDTHTHTHTAPPQIIFLFCWVGQGLSPALPLPLPRCLSFFFALALHKASDLIEQNKPFSYARIEANTSHYTLPETELRLELELELELELQQSRGGGSRRVSLSLSLSLGLLSWAATPAGITCGI